MLRRLVASVMLVVVVLAGASRARAEDKYFDSAGVKIHYTIEGQGPPVVLVHGFTASIQAQWGLPGIITKLKPDYKVIALDNRGHGRSDKPHDPKLYGPESVNDVVRLLDHLKIEKAHVVGYSMGAFMTNYLVATHPSRVLTATLGGAGWRKPDDTRMAVMNVLAESLDAGKGIGPLILALTPADRPKPDDKQIEMINQMVMAMNDQKALAACVRGMGNLTVTEAQLRANKVPTLALIGSDDPLKVGVDEMQGVMSNLTVEVIDGTDHMTAFRAPKFILDLKEFLSSHSAVPAGAAAGGQQ